MRLAVFDVLDLRLVSDERGGDVGIVDRAADRRVRDLVANAAAGLEAVGKAAAPQVRLVEVNAAAVLHDECRPPLFLCNRKFLGILHYTKRHILFQVYSEISQSIKFLNFIPS